MSRFRLDQIDAGIIEREGRPFQLAGPKRAELHARIERIDEREQVDTEGRVLSDLDVINREARAGKQIEAGFPDFDLAAERRFEGRADAGAVAVGAEVRRGEDGD